MAADSAALTQNLAPARARLQDYVALAKPNITLFNVITTAGGLLLARRAGGVGGAALDVSFCTAFCTFVGTALIVAGANALNMFIERDIDKHMPRTRNRPLPSGRMAPRSALIFGIALSALALPVLGFGVNALTALLALLANLLYVCAYTPLKQRTHYALHIGAVPGAIPPLLGWTAVTARVDGAALTLFAILFLWQIPHFLAITLFRAEDYKRAGLVVAPNVVSLSEVKHSIVRYSFALLAVSLLLYPLGVTGLPYVVCAAALGLIFWGAGLIGFRVHAGTPELTKWARTLFSVSLFYLVAMMALLGLHV
jgi:heme o synthase